MTKTKNQTRKARRDLEQEITDKVLAGLEAGTVPWRKPWTGRNFMPTSASTGRPYRGINAVLLWLEGELKGYASNLWLTYRQAAEFGGNVRKGEKGTLVVFWKRLEVKDTEATEPDATKTIMMMRHYTVFNLAQCDDVTLPPRFVSDTEPRPVPDVVTEVLEGYADGPKVTFQAGDSAHYSPSTDVVVLPLVEQFDTDNGFAGAAFHELVHSTGHASRLDRFERGGEPQHFGSQRYAREE